MNPPRLLLSGCSYAARWKWPILLWSSLCHAAKLLSVFSDLIGHFHLFISFVVYEGRQWWYKTGTLSYKCVLEGISSRARWLFLGIWCFTTSFPTVAFLPYVLIKSWCWILCTSSNAALENWGHFNLLFRYSGILYPCISKFGACMLIHL